MAYRIVLFIEDDGLETSGYASTGWYPEENFDELIALEGEDEQ